MGRRGEVRLGFDLPRSYMAWARAGSAAFSVFIRVNPALYSLPNDVSGLRGGRLN